MRGANLTRRVRLVLLTLLVGFVGVNAIAAAHAWRFTHFVTDGAVTAAPEALTPTQRAWVLLTGVVVPRPRLPRQPADVGLDPTTGVEVGVSTWTVPGQGRGTVLLFHID